MFLEFFKACEKLNECFLSFFRLKTLNSYFWVFLSLKKLNPVFWDFLARKKSHPCFLSFLKLAKNQNSCFWAFSVFFYGAFHGAPVLETLSFSRFFNDFSLHWDFEFFTFSPCTIDFEFLRFFHVLEILSFYDFLLYWRLWTFHCFPLY